MTTEREQLTADQKLVSQQTPGPDAPWTPPLWADAMGTRHTRAGADARIVSLVPSLTELLIDLGLREQLVGRTHFCIHPADVVATIPGIGGTKKVNLSKLQALRPTHVILNVDENTREMAAAITALGIATVVTHPITPSDNSALYHLLGGIFDREAAAAALSARLDQALARAASARQGTAGARVLYLIWKDPWMSISADTYIANMLAQVGWQVCHAAAEPRYPEVTLTAAMLAAVDLVLLSSEPYSFTDKDAAALADAHDFPRDRVRLIDGEYCSWYGSRAIAGIDYLVDFAARASDSLSR